MTFLTLPLVVQLMSAPPLPPLDMVKYPATPTPFASTTLVLRGGAPGVAVAARRNIEVNIGPAEYQELRVAHSFEIICNLPPNHGIRSIGAWADLPYHIIPVTVLEYKPFDPSYVRLEIDTSYLTNETNAPDFGNHEIHIDFFADQK